MVGYGSELLQLKIVKKINSQILHNVKSYCETKGEDIEKYEVANFKPKIKNYVN